MASAPGLLRYTGSKLIVLVCLRLALGPDVELVEVEVEASAQLVCRDAEVPMQVVVDATVLAPRITLQVFLKQPRTFGVNSTPPQW